jgi:hypothetical protein
LNDPLNPGERQLLLGMLRQEWKHHPNTSLCNLLADLVCEIEGHSKIGISDDRKLLTHVNRRLLKRVIDAG